MTKNTMRRTSRCLVVACAILMVGFGQSVRGQQGPEGLDRARAEVEELMQHARELKAEGRMEESEDVARKAKALAMGIKERMEQADRGGQERREQVERMRAEVKERIAMAKKEIGELKQNGHMEEAEQLGNKVKQMIAGLEERIRHGMAPERDVRKRLEGEKVPPGRELEEWKVRLDHLHQAIDHLHAAGLHEPAEDLGRQAQEWEQKLRREAGNREHGDPIGAFRENVEARLEKMERALREMSAGFQELRERSEQLSRRLKPRGF